MVTINQVGAIGVACFVLIVVPGPSVMFVVGRALSYGRLSVLSSVVGNAVGCYTVGVVVAFGLGSLLERFEILVHTIKWAGIAYLFWLGIRTFCHAPLQAENPPARTCAESVGKATRTGIIVGLTNPKSFVLFTAIVPQFINQAAGNVPLQFLLLGIVPLVIGLATDTSWALLAGRARTWITKSPKAMLAFGRIGGLSIIGVGVSVAVSDNRP